MWRNINWRALHYLQTDMHRLLCFIKRMALLIVNTFYIWQRKSEGEANIDIKGMQGQFVKDIFHIG